MSFNLYVGKSPTITNQLPVHGVSSVVILCAMLPGLMSVSMTFQLMHYANTPMQYTAIFHGCKNVHFQMIFLMFFLIFAQNIDCGYTLEPPH